MADERQDFLNSGQEPLLDESQHQMEAREEQLQLDKYLNRVGGVGRYQYFVFINVLLAMAGINFLIYNIFYLELYP